MPQFAYKARRRTGEVVQGVLDVADRTAALSQIERLGLFPVMVDASKSEKIDEQRSTIKNNMEAMVNDIAVTQNGQATPEQSARIARMEDAVRPASRNLLLDILTDKNGITLHRLQIVMWTLALATIFVVQVFLNLTFPEFDPTILALMGLSSGVYLGFKIPERHFEKPEQT